MVQRILCKAQAAMLCMSVLVACDSGTLYATRPGSALEAQDALLSVTMGQVAQGVLHVATDGDEPMLFSLVDSGKLGTATVTNPLSGAFTYKPSGATGFDTFTFLVSQGPLRSNIATVQVAITDGGISGAVTYDFVPTLCAAGNCALDYNATVQRPVRNALIRLLDANDRSTVLQQSQTDALGRYIFAPITAARAVVAVSAAMTSPGIQVGDNTQGGATYVVASDPVPNLPGLIVEMRAGSGWTGSAYGNPRAAAPFALLDTAYTATQAFTAARPAAVFAPLQIYWSVNNVPEAGDPSAGQIGSTHWDGTDLWVLGAADVDTDEYDTHVVLHEWAHYFETTCSRSDSLGRDHTPGATLDLRVAFSEGWGDAVGAMVLYPDTVYSDTSGPQQGQGFSFDLRNSDGYDPLPGWFSEASVGGIVFELFSPANPNAAWDNVQLGLGAIYDVMVGPHKSTPALTSIFSFVQGAKQLNGSAAAGIDAIVAHRQIATIDDSWGTGQTNDGGLRASLPVYQVAGGLPASWTLDLHTESGPVGTDVSFYNLTKLGTNRLVHWVGDGQPTNITVTSSHEVDLVVYGPIPAGSDAYPYATLSCSTPPNCSQGLTRFPTIAGADYVVDALSFDETVEDSTCTLTIGH